MTSSEDSLTILLKSLSHPLRRRILHILESRNNAAFSELLFLCGLDIYYQKGMLDYHLKKLYDAGVVTKIGNQYVVSGVGREISNFLKKINHDYDLNTKKTIVRGEKKVKISIRTLPDSRLIFKKYSHPVGEERTYVVKTPSFESPFPMPNKIKETLLKGDKVSLGIKTLESYTPEWVSEQFPLKVGDKGSTRETIDEETSLVIDWEIPAQYEVKINSHKYECLMKRELYTTFLKDKKDPKAPQFVTDRYYARDLLKVLYRRWDELEWLKKVGYKKWEICPTLNYKDRIWYLTEERCLVEIKNTQTIFTSSLVNDKFVF